MMSGTPEQSAREIFDEVIEAPDAERAQLIERLCAEDEALRIDVQELIDAHIEADDAGFFRSPTSGGVDAEALGAAWGEGLEVLEGPGTAIGSYTLLELIGEGGFGQVYMAQQNEPVQRRVALKIIKLGMDTKQVIARFEAERQALALMDHPNIAHVFDAGSTATGRPYFVMELVRGVPITEFCDLHRLTARERLELFSKVCMAVQHAHQKGVIHRDIKPGNVLVTLHDGSPVPKVIDFGIAKATSARLTERTLFTEFRQFVGTPQYMSPEQAEMSGLDVDTRSDVYSLGVLLYELLTGTTPFDPVELRQAAYDEIRRIIRTVDPPRPSTRLSALGEAAAGIAQHRRSDRLRLIRQVRGDLDWIIMRTLEKDRRRRYDTASDLARDVERYLRGEPVWAGPPTARYRMGKFVRRHRAGVGVVAMVAVLLVAGVSGTTTGLVRSMEAERRAVEEAEAAVRARTGEAEQRQIAQERAAEAQRQAAIAQAVNDFLNEDLLALASPMQLPEPEIKMRTVLDRALAGIDDRFPAQPEVEAAVRATLGDAYSGLGLYETAQEQYERALEIQRGALGDDDPETIGVAAGVASTLIKGGRYAEAEELLRALIERSIRVNGADDGQTLSLRESRGRLYELTSRFEESVEELRAIVAMIDESGKAQSAFTLSMRNSLAYALDRAGEFEEAQSIYEKVLDGRRRVLGEDHPMTVTTQGNLGLLHFNVGRYTEAKESLTDALERSVRILGEEHDYTLTLMGNLALAHQNLNQRDEAHALFRRTHVLYEKTLGAEHPTTLHAMYNLGSFLASQGQFEEAESLLVTSLEGRRRLFGAEHFDTQVSMAFLGRMYYQQQRFEEAEPLITEALELARASLGPEHQATLSFMNTLASMYSAQERYDEAIPVYRETIAILKRVMPPGFVGTGVTSWGLGQALNHTQRWKEAEPVWLEAHEILSATFGPQHPRTIQTIEGLVEVYVQLGREGKAAEWSGRLPPIDTSQP